MPPFKYEPFQNPYVGSIIDLMGQGDEAKAQALTRVGEIEAQAARQRGQIWSGAVQNVGSAVSQGIQSWQDEKAQAKAQARIDEDRAKADILWSRGEDEFNERKRAAALGRRAFSGSTNRDTQIGPMPTYQTEADGSMMMEDVPTPPGMLPSQRPVIDEHPYQTMEASGLLLWNPAKLLEEGTANGSLEAILPYVAAMESANATKKSNHEATIASAKETAVVLLGMSDEGLVGAVPEALGFFKGSLPPSMLTIFEQAVATGDPSEIRGVLNRFAGVAKKPGYTLGLNDRRYDGENNPVAFGPGKPLTLEEKIIAASARGDEPELERLHALQLRLSETAASVETARHNLVTADLKGRELDAAEEESRPVVLSYDANGDLDLHASMSLLGLDTISQADSLHARADMWTTGLLTSFPRLVGPVFGGAEKTMGNIAAIDLAEHAITRALQKNTRLPDAERKAIRKSLDMSTGRLRSPDFVRLKFKEIDTVLRMELQSKRNVDDVRSILQVLDLLGVPNDSATAEASPVSDVPPPDLKDLKFGQVTLFQGGPHKGERWTINSLGRPARVDP